MMRNLASPDPTPLLNLCRYRRWPEVINRLRNHPCEAAPTEAALRGEKSTILSLALRIGAPVEVIEALIRADRRQLVVCHRLAGSVIHEALRSMVEDQVFFLIFSQALQEQEAVQRGWQSNRQPAPQFSPQFQHVHVQEKNRVVQAPNLLEVQDDIGRTVLHQIVEQVARRRIIMGRPPNTTFGIFKQIVQAHPDLVHKTDSDGNTPLILLLSQHHDVVTPSIADRELEDEIFTMVQYLTTNFPSTVAHVRRMPRPWRFMNLPLHAATRFPVSSPLYYAILYGRSTQTLNALLQAHNELGMNGCAAIVTHHGEFCLHVAVTLRAPLHVLRLLVEAYPAAVASTDIYGLTPIDWLWMTHVVDHNAPNGNQLRLSRRRHLGRDFREWHDHVTERIPYRPDRYDVLDEIMVEQMQIDFLHRLRLMLSTHRQNSQDNIGETGLLPLVCQLPNLPFGILKLVLAMDRQAVLDVAKPDSTGCYPLHHIAKRTRGYRATLPLGVTSRVQILTETKDNLAIAEIIEKCPSACQVVDANGQLPLHIAIDAAKADRSCGEPGVDEEYTSAVVEALLEAYPESLGVRDGITQLFPWQQAAAGRGANLGTVFELLRREPILLV